ncbi:hypothetical protein [Paracoccus sp. Ld10]|uniref:hypothetical protein n=1 Tax=Paracoccus sp. Ld10 TaxID=649158 RepID=UPI00386FBF40
MTAHANTSFTVTAEAALPAFTHSPVSLAFASMSRALADHIEAERDLIHSGSWDIACDAWLRDAEAVRETLLTALDQITALPVQRVEDKPMRDMASVIRALVVSGNALEALQLEVLAVDHGPLLRCHDDHLLAGRVNLWLQTAEQQLIALRALPDYADTIDGSCTEVGIEPNDPEDVFEVPEDIDLRESDNAVDVVLDEASMPL